MLRFFQFKESSAIACSFHPGSENYISFVIKNYTGAIIDYDDIKIYSTGNNWDDISFYKADEFIRKVNSKFNTGQPLSAFLMGFESSKETTNILSDSTEINNRTILSNEQNVYLEKMKVYNQSIKEQAYLIGGGMKKIADNLLYLPTNEISLDGNIFIKNIFVDGFTVKIKIGNDTHEFRFNKVKI